MAVKNVVVAAVVVVAHRVHTYLLAGGKSKWSSEPSGERGGPRPPNRSIKLIGTRTSSRARGCLVKVAPRTVSTPGVQKAFHFYRGWCWGAQPGASYWPAGLLLLWLWALGRQLASPVAHHWPAGTYAASVPTYLPALTTCYCSRTPLLWLLQFSIRSTAELTGCEIGRRPWSSATSATSVTCASQQRLGSSTYFKPTSGLLPNGHIQSTKPHPVCSSL